jgi:hypothetical protein
MFGMADQLDRPWLCRLNGIVLGIADQLDGGLGYVAWLIT